MSFSPIARHACITSSEAVLQVAQPLFELLPINYFRFFKLWPDGGYIRLSTHAAWTYHYMNHHYMNHHYNSVASPHTLFKPGETSFYLFDVLVSKNDFSNVLKEARELYDLDHGLSIQEIFEDHIEIYDITASSHCCEINELYLQHMDSIKKFIRYFRVRAQKIIEQVEGYKFKTTAILLGEEDETLKKKEKFNREIELSYLNVDVKGSCISLTKRATQCVIELIQGSSNKMIGKTLNISPRTVESYMESIKIKLNCDGKNQIIKKFMKNCNVREFLLN